MQVLTNVVNFFFGIRGSHICTDYNDCRQYTGGNEDKGRDFIRHHTWRGIYGHESSHILYEGQHNPGRPGHHDLYRNLLLPIVDGGWSTMATISWAWPYAFLMLPLLIAVNVVMILLNKTNTINADLWNVWLKIFTAVAVVSITHSVILAFVIAAVQIILELKSSDAHQHRIEKLTEFRGVRDPCYVIL